jgi:RNA polymerase sigma-70 factor (family 1)
LPEPDNAQLEAGQPVKDRESFAAVFRRYYAPLVRYAGRITGDAALAADVLQDVFLKLWEDRGRLTIEVSLKAMLYTMVRNRALNVNRREKRVAREVVVEEVLERRGAEPAGESAMTAAELQQHLHRWIEELPARQREAFTLSRFHGLMHCEIAGIMGISERTVDTHIVLALRKLRRRLDELQNEGTSP